MATVTGRRDVAARTAQTGRNGSQAPAVRSQTLVTATMLSLAAGVIHAVAMVDHFDHYWLYGAFFLVVTYAQLIWAVWVYRHPGDRRALVAGVAGNLLVVAVWVISRTVGTPVGPQAWDPEPVGVMDLMATLDQLVLAALAVVLVAPAGRLAARLSWLRGGHAVRIGIMLCSASLFSLLLGNHSHH